MAIRNFHVRLSPQEATKKIQEWVLGSSISGVLVDQYERKIDDYVSIIFILEKYYMRSNNRASLTVTIDNFDGETTVHAVAAGSSEGLLRFDWGAGKNFSRSVEDALMAYIIREFD